MNGHLPTPDQKAPSPDPAARMTRRRRLILIVVLAVAAVLLVVALVPRVLSIGPFRRMALRAVNKRLNGTVEMKSWSLRWVSGFRFREVKVVDEYGETVLESDAVNLRTTVFGLLGEKKNLRLIEVLSPRVNLVINEDGTNNVQSLFPPSEEEPTNIEGRLLVQDGVIDLSMPAYDARFVLADVGMDVGIEGLEAPLAVQLTGKLGEEKAALVVTGTVSAPSDEAGEDSAPEAALNVKLNGFDVANVSQLGQGFGAPIEAAGKADVILDAALSRSGDVQVSGNVAVQSLALAGGSPLLKDKPVLPEATVAFDVSRTGSGVHISDLRMTSPLLNGRVKGSIAVSPEGVESVSDLTINGTVDLAEMAREFPKALALRKGLKVQRGTLAFDASVNSVGRTGVADVSVQLKDLAARLDGRDIRLDSPVELTAKASVDAEGRAKLSSLNLTSSFMNAEGHGDQEAFEAKLTSDLEAAMAEISKFADLDGKTLSGKAEVAVQASYADPSAPRISASFELDAVKTTGFFSKPIDLPDAGVSFEGVLVPGGSRDSIRVRDLTGKLHLPVTGATFDIEALAARGRGLPRISGGRINGKLNVGDAVALLRYIGSSKAQIYAQGQMDYACQFATAGDVVTIEKLRATVDPLKISGDRVPTIENDRLVFDADMKLQMKSGSVEVSRFDLTSGLGQVKGNASLAGLGAGRVLRAEGEIKCDFERIGPLVATMIEQPIRMHGSAFRPFKVRATLGESDWRETLAKTTASLGTYLTGVALADFETGPVEMGITLRNGEAALKIDAAVAGVEAHLPLVINLMGDPMIVTVPPSTAILTDAQFSTGLADRFVSRAAPLFNGCVVTAGSVGFTCNEFSAPLDATALEETAMRANLILKGVRLDSAGFLSEALDLFRISGYGMELPDQEVGITLQGGRVQQQPISLQVSKYALTLSGAVGLAKRDLDMFLKVPLTRELIGKDAYEVLKEEVIEVHITGTVDAPAIERNLIRANVDRLLKSAVRGVVEEKAKDLIKGEVNKALEDLLKGGGF